MIHGYHIIFGTYGFWLPNDPRGSWSDFVASWELLRFGKSAKGMERLNIAPDELERWLCAAREALRFPSVSLSAAQIRGVATGFGNSIRKSQYGVWACSILPEHVHVVVGRHSYNAEQIANLLKGEATKALNAESIHPQRRYADETGKVPSMWAEKQWVAYLDSEIAIERAIRYVEENPVRESRPRQTWPFVTPFAGISRAGWITYH
jgi:REP element-mobilizing transposase RayT